MANDGRVSPELQHEIEQVLYEEAAMLDEGRFHEWLALLADDVWYWMPISENRLRRERELGNESELRLFDEDRDSLTRRVKRVDTGMAWAEDPPSRTRHLVSNVQVRPTAKDDELEVVSAFLLYRTRLETDENLFAGRREDLWRRTDSGQWQMARRKILLDQNVILSKNMSILF